MSIEESIKGFSKSIDENNRYKRALEWKAKGKKVIGFISDYVPEEVIFAAGMLPYRIMGSWKGDVSKANLYRPHNTDLYATHVLQSLLEGKLDFLDGVIIPHMDDDQRRLYDLWIHLNKASFVYYLYIPRKQSGFCIEEFSRGIKRLKTSLEDLSGNKITEGALYDSILIYNKWRSLLTDIYKLRRKELPPLTGHESHALVVSSFVVPKNEFNNNLESIVNQIRCRKVMISKKRPRILVSSEDLDNPAYLELIEECGCLIAMDDLNTGSKYFWKEVNLDSDPYYALAERYLSKPGEPRMFNWNQYISQIISWVKEYEIDAVLNLPAMYAYWRELFTPYLHERLEKKDIPIMTFLREYRFANEGQLKTRIQAFLEIVETRI